MHSGMIAFAVNMVASYQNINGLHFCQSLKVPVGMVQIQGHAVDMFKLRASRQHQLGVAPLQQLVVVLNAPLVMALNEGHLEGGV